MSLINDNIKNIKITALAIFFIVSYLILFILGRFNFIIDEKWIYLIVIFYFIFKLRGNLSDLKDDVANISSKIGLKYILVIVFLNIFFSYGMLYLASALIGYFPFLEFFTNSKSLTSMLPYIGGFISTVVIASISEELIFRGVLLSRLRIYVPTVFAIVISSLLFGALHSFGSIISAFVFAVCMAILYLKTENICVPILAHFLNNLFAEIIRMLDVGELLFTDGLVMGVVSILAIISAVILFISIIKELNNIK